MKHRALIGDDEHGWSGNVSSITKAAVMPRQFVWIRNMNPWYGQQSIGLEPCSKMFLWTPTITLILMMTPSLRIRAHPILWLLSTIMPLAGWADNHRIFSFWLLMPSASCLPWQNWPKNKQCSTFWVATPPNSPEPNADWVTNRRQPSPLVLAHHSFLWNPQSMPNF